MGIKPSDLRRERDIYWMTHALALARKAQDEGEVPVGAVIIKDNVLISEGWNQSIIDHDPTAHAEIIAIRHASQSLKNYRLPDSTLYVTLEPCTMCAGAIIHARIARVVFGTSDPRGGAAGSVFSILGTEKLNHFVEITSNVMQEESAKILKSFFQARR